MSKHIRTRWKGLNAKRRRVNERRARVGLPPVASLTEHRRTLRALQVAERAAKETP